MSWINKTVALFVGLVLVACSKQEPQALQTEPSTHSESAYTGPKETVSLALNADLDSEARALEGSEFYRGRLRPRITNGKANVLLYLGSKDLNQFSANELDFDYDKETNSIHYRGEIQVPEGLLGASDLKMLLVVANKQKISNNTLTMRNVNTEVFENKLFPDGEVLPIDVPYFSEWIDVHNLVTTSYNEKQKKMEPFLDVARTSVLLRPQGHVIKMEVSSFITNLQDVTLKALQVESNAITDGGTYTLPTTINDIGKKPAFTPDLTEVVNAPEGYKFDKFEVPFEDKVLSDDKTYTLYIWVAPIPEQTAEKWTRTFAKVHFPKPIVSNFASESWNRNARLFPVYYTKGAFSRTGSTMTMRLDDIMLVSPIERFAYSYVSSNTAITNTTGSTGYSGFNVIGGPNLTPLGLITRWEERQYTDYSAYTLQWLREQNYLGATPAPIIFTAGNAGDANSIDVPYYIPTIEEFRALLPTDPTVAKFFRFIGAQTKFPSEEITERVRLGDRKTTAPQNYQSSYKFIKSGDPRDGYAIRFKGGDNRHKTFYLYQMRNANANGIGRLAVVTKYLGAFYPEIETPEDVLSFVTKYPGATSPNDNDNFKGIERELPYNRNLHEAAAGKQYFGNKFWINTMDDTKGMYMEYEYIFKGTLQQRELNPATQGSEQATLLVRRDLK